MRLNPGKEDATLYAESFSVNWWGEDVHFFFDQTLRVWRMVGGVHDFLIKDGVFVLIQGSPQGDALLLVHEPRQRYDEDERRHPIRQLILARAGGSVQVVFKARFKPQRVFWSDDGQHAVVLVRERYEEDFELEQRWLFVSSSNDEEYVLPGDNAEKVAEMILSPEGQIVAYRESEGNQSVLRDANHNQLVAGKGISDLEYGEVLGRQYIRYSRRNWGTGKLFPSLVYLS